mgnify:CR=1 FL=1
MSAAAAIPMDWINEKAKTLRQGAIRAMFDKASTMDNVISMGIGEPDMATPELVCRAGNEALEKGITHYTPNAGTPALRRAIAEKSNLKGVGYDPTTEIIITNGGMGALSLLFLVLLNPGDEVLIQDPQWLNYVAQVRYCGGEAVRVPTDLEHNFTMQPEAIEQLAKNIFAAEESHITTVLAFEIPRTRAFMHLDTVFTQVDHDKFTVHPGILGALSVYELTGKGERTLKTRKLEAPLEDILKHYLHLDSVQLIRCGGESPIAAAREQWSDGSNTLCIRPGVVLVYDRNYVTNRILNDCGIETLEMPSSELSRGRGGPRCMSMPLVRKNP